MSLIGICDLPFGFKDCGSHYPVVCVLQMGLRVSGDRRGCPRTSEGHHSAYLGTQAPLERFTVIYWRRFSYLSVQAAGTSVVTCACEGTIKPTIVRPFSQKVLGLSWAGEDEFGGAQASVPG